MPTFLQSSGAISINDINTVFGRGNDLNSYRGTTYYTSSAGPFTFSSGTINMSDFYGTGPAGNSFNGTISTNQNKLNLRTWALANGWNGTTAATITLASGVYIYSDDIATAALTIDGSWPGGLTFVNNGYVMGMGGQGGGWYQFTASGGTVTYSSNYSLSAGGNAISMGVSCTIQNNSYIGGGGGGGGASTQLIGTGYTGGGGAGGGAGGVVRVRNENVSPVTDTTTYGGAGGSTGASGSNGNTATGGGGGRIMPGTNVTASVTCVGSTTSATATSTGGGANNSGSASTQAPATGSTGTTVSSVGLGGSGGGTGAVYSGIGAYAAFCAAGGGAGGWGASGGSGSGSGSAGPVGAAGGKCVNLNGYTVTWSATGTRYGAIS